MHANTQNIKIIQRTNMEKTVKRIAVTPHVKKLMDMATKKVMVETQGEVQTINDALKHILEYYLEKDE